MLSLQLDIDTLQSIGGIEFPVKSNEIIGSPTINQSCGCTQRSFCGTCAY